MLNSNFWGKEMKKTMNLFIMCFFLSVILSGCMPQPSFLKKLNFIEKSSIPSIKDVNDSTNAQYYAYIFEYLLIREEAKKVMRHHYVGSLKFVDSTVYFDYSNISYPPDLDSIKSFSFSINDIKKLKLEKIKGNIHSLIFEMNDEYTLYFIIDNEKFYDKLRLEN